MNAIVLALISAVGYGIATPLAKAGFNKGLHADGFVFFMV